MPSSTAPDSSSLALLSAVRVVSGAASIFWVRTCLATLVAAVALMSLQGGVIQATAQDGVAASRSTPTAQAVVELVIDYGDGVEKRFTQLAHRPEITVFELLMLAARHPRGVRVEHRGKGETAFVMQIDELRNEGRGRNWTYRVNGKRADRGADVFSLSPGDKVVWTFGG